MAVERHVYSLGNPTVIAGSTLLAGPNTIDFYVHGNGTTDGFSLMNASLTLPLSDTTPDASRDNSVMPVMPAAGTFVFDNPQPGRWFDPPVVEGLTISLPGGGRFLEVIAPPGFDDLSILVGGVVLTSDLDAGESFLLGSGVSSFDIVGISPLLDPDDPGFGTAFPLFLDITNPPGTTMTWTAIPVPEPASWASLALGLLLLGLVRVLSGQHGMGLRLALTVQRRVH